MTPYRDFSELVLHAVKGKDYRIDIVDRGTEVTVIAVHGGAIEPLTSELAVAIAGQEYNLYDLRGLRHTGSDEMRIPVARFSEMRLQELLKRSRVAVSIEGTEGAEAGVHVGGRNKPLRLLVTESLQAAGLNMVRSASSTPSHYPTLFYNTPADGGIQIELTRGLREAMAGGSLADLAPAGGAPDSELFRRCVEAVRSALEQYRRAQRDDLDAAMRRFEDTTREFVAMLRDTKRDELN